MSNPSNNTDIVPREHPFHSFNKIPQTFEKTTFNDINILHENASRIGEEARKVFPNSSPKNCEYHSNPANAQNSTLFNRVDDSTLKYSFPVLFLMFWKIQ